MTDRKPGEWPVTTTVDLSTAEPTPVDEQGEQHLKLTAARARFDLVLGSVRADLEEQPSERSVRTAARRWCNAITALADETAQRLKKTG
ncbi:hypothetical protein KQY30_24805 [Streptomyces sp. GMY02]|uniref:hypothetical protein n=1 Tax=Streptomyces sp. GMY02 TaxID=1333528 RepID=UPI001C2C3755|nr:hypothetical protein [Streptomyces sp. GMY02]QXE36948.1 hypothetical protein KQY30_24805 [Streptomyces sp. GMY02]